MFGRLSLNRAIRWYTIERLTPSRRAVLAMFQSVSASARPVASNRLRANSR